jgi:NAD(P)-dependent dehydrogenase (short-subunit alcohol dehydrogenase family)
MRSGWKDPLISDIDNPNLKPMNTEKAILITGTSSGIGRSCALHMDQLGYRVFAGVRKKEDGDHLLNETSERLQPVLLDVTDQNSIQLAVELIGKETDGKLFGLINNAGIGRGGALEATPLEEIQKLMDVNVIGLMAVTKACIPMIRKAKGRIINIGSTANYLAIPGSSVYAASKFAVKAFTDAMRLELKPFDIDVILVSPGAVESAIWEKGLLYRKRLREVVDPEIAELYAPLRRFGDRIYKEIKPIPAMEVAKTVAMAFDSGIPKRYYIVGKDAKGAAKAAKLPKWLLDRIILKRIEKLSK